MILRLAGTALLMFATVVFAADQALGVLDLALGASYARLEHELDFRDIGAAIAQVKSGRPDLGRRGYGCMKREDPYADIACVSHDEKLDAIATREIRLHFLAGRLQQFSLTAEVQHYEAVVDYLRRRYGEPRQLEVSAEDAPALRWQDELGHVVAYRGKDQVFVSFELAAYADAVKRKREGPSFECS